MLIGRRLPYWVIYLTLAIAVVVLTSLIPDSGVGAATNDVEKPGETTIDVVKAMIGVVTTLNTTMLAAAAALSVKGNAWTSKWDRMDGALTIGAFIAGALSYYGVYWAYVALLEMIEAGAISASSPRLQRGLGMQYYGTLAGFVLLGLVFSRMMEGRRAGKSEKD